MGNFIDMAAVLAPQEKVEAFLESADQDYASGCFNATDDRTLVLFENSTGDLSRVQDLSKGMGVPVFGLHIHDDDFWMYKFYLSGEQIDQFNPIPNYWVEIPEDLRQTWAGNADTIAKHWPGISAKDIERYLVFQDSDDFDGEKKAYSTDEFAAWDPWQVCDFLGRLGTPYPD